MRMTRNDGVGPGDNFVAESGLGLTTIAMRSDNAAIADCAIRINLRGLGKEWFIGHNVGKIKINDATFALEGNE